MLLEDVDAHARAALEHLGITILIEGIDVEADEGAEAHQIVVHHVDRVAVDPPADAIRERGRGRQADARTGIGRRVDARSLFPARWRTWYRRLTG